MFTGTQQTIINDLLCTCYHVKALLMINSDVSKTIDLHLGKSLQSIWLYYNFLAIALAVAQIKRNSVG